MSPEFPETADGARGAAWRDVPAADWNDWRWQLRSRVETAEALARIFPLSEAERRGFDAARGRLAFAATPHFLSLIDGRDPADPLRRQIVPDAREAFVSADESDDPIGEETHSPVPGLVHRYPDRVLLLATDRCACYCRFCTRSRLVSGAAGYDFHPHLDEALRYVAAHAEIRDVLISGGDALLLSDAKIAELLARVRAIPHVELVRVGTRVPVFLPQRVTPELCGIFRRNGVLWMNVHVNHPREISPATAAALERLALAGVALGSQTVLLRGVNDDAATLRALVHRLLRVRVRPYYLYACDKIRGSAHWRVPVREGVELIRSLRGWTSGLAVPQFVIDAPGGGGKVPVNPDYVESFDDAGRVRLRNFRGETYFY
ncbi:MAG: KamA family radical SAM protein [Candidatus Spyradosoma sp.]